MNEQIKAGAEIHSGDGGYSIGTQEKYEEMYKSLESMDLTKVIELDDYTDLAGELACVGGQCQV